MSTSKDSDLTTSSMLRCINSGRTLRLSGFSSILGCKLPVLVLLERMGANARYSYRFFTYFIMTGQVPVGPDGLDDNYDLKPANWEDYMRSYPTPEALVSELSGLTETLRG